MGAEINYVAYWGSDCSQIFLVCLHLRSLLPCYWSVPSPLVRLEILTGFLASVHWSLRQQILLVLSLCLKTYYAISLRALTSQCPVGSGSCFFLYPSLCWPHPYINLPSRQFTFFCPRWTCCLSPGIHSCQPTHQETFHVGTFSSQIRSQLARYFVCRVFRAYVTLQSLSQNVLHYVTRSGVPTHYQQPMNKFYGEKSSACLDRGTSSVPSIMPGSS